MEEKQMKKEYWPTMSGMIKKVFKSKIQRTVFIAFLILILCLLILFGISNVYNQKPETKQLGFRNIGELATQIAYCTEVNLTDSSVQLWGWDVPFTQSKYIYSYDVAIKAGYDFSKIEWTVNRSTGKISVFLPEAIIISAEINPESFEVYHEKESAFNQINLKDNNEALIKLREDALNTAIDNGLLENARANAEVLITAFLRSDYPQDKYVIEFFDQQQ